MQMLLVFWKHVNHVCVSVCVTCHKFTSPCKFLPKRTLIHSTVSAQPAHVTHRLTDATIIDPYTPHLTHSVRHKNLFNIRFGVRQGSVLSPYLFSIYIDDVGKLCDSRNGWFVLLYADDILLINSSVSELQSLRESSVSCRYVTERW